MGFNNSLAISSLKAIQSGRNASRNPREFKPVKGLNCPAARSTGTVRLVLSRPFISLEKNGGLRCHGEPIRYLCKNLSGNYWLVL